MRRMLGRIARYSDRVGRKLSDLESCKEFVEGIR